MNKGMKIYIIWKRRKVNGKYDGREGNLEI
jgi:hypothetical protein